MHTFPKQLLTIMTEAVIEKNLVADCRRLGAQGYTVLDVRGGGVHGEREGAWEADRSIELQVVCAAAVAEQIAQHVLTHYAPHYGVTLYLSQVQVLRGEKY